MANFVDMTQRENRFVFVAPMYNATETLPRLLHSLFGQSYNNWQLWLIDDVSDRQHVEETSRIITRFKTLCVDGKGCEKVRIRFNKEKKWEVANVLYGIRESYERDDDIICRIDADDWLTDLDALQIINDAYNQSQCDILWTAHRWGFSDKNISGPMSEDANPYKHPWVSSHLKTFRRYLLDSVSDENFKGPEGEYIRRAGDQAIYLPALHKAKKRAFLPRVMYHYTINDVPETYQTDDAKFQRDEALFLRERGFVE